MQRVYLDNAATSWPKPNAVYEAVQTAMRELGAPAGRSAYREAADVERQVAHARHLLAGLLNAEDPRRVVFTSNATDSLNLAIHGSVRRGDHVVTSVVEHNSVLRPLRHLETQLDVETTYLPCNAQGVVASADVEAAIRPRTRLIVLSHASNVTGAVQPCEEVGRIAAAKNKLFLVDAAQTLGHWPVDVRKLGCSMLAAPGHKGLLGPLGVGLLYVAPGVEDWLESARQGGTGTQSESDEQPDSLPDKYEAGNHNVPGILGLLAGLRFVLETGIGDLQAQQAELMGRLLDGLSSAESMTLFGPRNPDRQVGVVSLSLAGYDPQEVAGMLEAAHRIQVRSGLHCAPRMHQALRTLDAGGTVRLSVGPFNTKAQMDLTIRTLLDIAGMPR